MSDETQPAAEPVKEAVVEKPTETVEEKKEEPVPATESKVEEKPAEEKKEEVDIKEVVELKNTLEKSLNKISSQADREQKAAEAAKPAPAPEPEPVKGFTWNLKTDNDAKQHALEISTGFGEQEDKKFILKIVGMLNSYKKMKDAGR